jgi:alpha-mannosidase
VTLALGEGISGKDAIRAWDTDGCERRLHEVAVRDGKLVFELGAFGIRTFEIQFAPSPVQEQAFTCAPLDLPFDTRAFTTDRERAHGALPGGRSFPLELLPAEVMCGGIPLKLGIDQDKQALSCRGQTIALPEGGFDRLILLASADEDVETAVYLDQIAYPLSIQAGEGFIGLWDRRTWDRPTDKQPDYRWRAKVTGLEPGYIKRDRVGCYTTHMHSADGNEPYAYGYMFLYTLPIPAGTRELRLPDDSRIRLFAATAAKGVASSQPATALYDTYSATQYDA